MNNFGQLIRLNPRSEIVNQDTTGTSNLGELSVRSQLGLDPERIRKPRAIIASVILDTSGSMKEFIDHEGKRQAGQQAVIRCQHRMLEEFKQGESERHAVILGTWGFEGMIHPYLLPQDVPLLDTSMYVPRGGTPLFDTIDECFSFAKIKGEQFRSRKIPCTKAFLIVSDGNEQDSVRASLKVVQKGVRQILTEGGFIFGIGMGEEGCKQLQQLNIPEEMIRDVSRSLGLGALFREFTTMTTQGVRADQHSRSTSRRNGEE